jgi:hypothetical protein
VKFPLGHLGEFSGFAEGEEAFLVEADGEFLLDAGEAFWGWQLEGVGDIVGNFKQQLGHVLLLLGFALFHFSWKSGGWLEDTRDKALKLGWLGGWGCRWAPPGLWPSALGCDARSGFLTLPSSWAGRLGMPIGSAIDAPVANGRRIGHPQMPSQIGPTPVENGPNRYNRLVRRSRQRRNPMPTHLNLNPDLLQEAIDLDSETPIETLIETALRTYIDQRKQPQIDINTNSGQSFGESIVAFREKHNISQMDIDPDEIWGDVRDRTFVGEEASFE